MSQFRIPVIVLVVLTILGGHAIERVTAQDNGVGAVADSLEQAVPRSEREAFRTQRMSIELVGTRAESYSAFRNEHGGSWHRWTVFRGGEPIPEEDFLSEAGYYRYAQEASSFHRDARHNLIAGVFLTVLGGVATYIGYNMEEFLESQHGPSKGLMGAGITISGLGIGLSISSGLKTRRQWAPFSRAYDITNEYNHDLVEQLKEDQ